MQQAGNVDTVEYLLERGAAPSPSAIAHTALRAASIFGHEHVARMLLQAQADPNMCRWGITACDACTLMYVLAHVRIRVCVCVCVCVVSLHVYTFCSSACMPPHQCQHPPA